MAVTMKTPLGLKNAMHLDFLDQNYAFQTETFNFLIVDY